MAKPKLTEQEKKRAEEKKIYEDAITALGRTGHLSPHDRTALRAACSLIAARDSGSGSVVQGFTMGLLQTATLGKGKAAKDAGRLHDNLPRVIDTLQHFVDRRTPVPKRMRPLCALYVSAWRDFGESLNSMYDMHVERMTAWGQHTQV